MKKRILTLCVALLLSCFSTLFVGCLEGDWSDSGSGNSSDETVINPNAPVYTGMTVSGSGLSSEPVQQSRKMKQFAEPDHLHDDWYSWPCYYCDHYYGDFRGEHDHFPPDHPFDYDHNHNGKIDDNEKKDDVGTVVKDFVIGADAPIYYTEQNKDFYITVRLNNPYNYEILSFTLNGKRYSSYMFESGSDMENLILKLNVGDKHGVLDYSIDAIKYVDGTQIKDVVMEGDKTVCVGVHTDNSVSAEVENSSVTYNSFSFVANISDPDKLVDFSEGEVRAFLYDGNSIVEDLELQVEKANNLIFDDLVPNSIYQYVIVAFYDDFDNEGFSSHIIYKDTFVTDYIVLFDNVVVANDGITFELAQNEKLTGIEIKTISLLKDEILVKNILPSDLSVSGLLSETEYVLKAEFDYDDKACSIYIYFTTTEKSVPVVTIEELQSATDSISFDLNIVDEDNICEVSKIELIDESGIVVATKEGAVRAFSDLLSDKLYTVKVTYTYNPNTGNLIQLEAQATVKTKAKVAPSFVFTDQTSTWNGITLKYDITDSDKTIKDFNIEVLDGEKSVAKSTDLAEAVFSDLKCGYEYTIKAEFVYNLNSGAADVVQSSFLSVKTPVYKDSDGVHYAVTAEDEVAVVGYDKGITKAVFESYVCGYPVTSVKKSVFYKCDTLKLVTLPSTMLSIGESAFEECRNIKSVDLNEGLQTIAAKAFKYCFGVKYVVIPESVAKVGAEGVNFGVYNSDTTLFVHWKARYYSDMPQGWDYNYEQRVFDGIYWGDSTVFDFKEFVSDGNFVYALKNEGTLSVIEYLTPQNKELVIPSEYEGYPVTEIGIKCFVNIKIDSLVLPDKLERIHKYAFYRSEINLDCVSFPSALKVIEEYSFYNALHVNKVEINGTPDIGKNAFSYGEFYRVDFSIVFPDEYEEYYFESNLVSGWISEAAFGFCRNLKYINIPANYARIDNNVFEECQKLNIASLADRRRDAWNEHFEGTVPNVLWKSYIDNNGIVYCVNDEIKYDEKSTLSVTGYLGEEFEAVIRDRIGNKIVTVVKTNAFFDSTALTVYYPHTIQVFGERCFGVYDSGDSRYGTEYYEVYDEFAYSINEELKTANIIKYIGDEKEVFLPEEINGYKVVSVNNDLLQKIKRKEINGAYYLSSASNPYFALMDIVDNTVDMYNVYAGTKIIGKQAFSSCGNLKKIVIPDSVISIDQSAFYRCDKLASLEIPDSVIFIGESAFGWCAALTDIVIPDGVVYIDDYAFSGCVGLKKAVVSDSVRHIGQCAFEHCNSLETITLPFVGSNVSNVYSESHFGYIFGARDDSRNAEYVPGSIKTVVICNKKYQTTIGSSAFSGCSGLTSVVIQDGVTSIGSSAFKGCSGLTSVVIQDGVTSIGSSAFSGCSGLTSIVIPDSVLDIGSFAFYGCSELTSVVIQDGVTSIGSSAFSGCSGLTSIVIPDSVLDIGSFAFYGCSGLESITLPFIGATLNGKENTHFGYIFGASSYLSNINYVPIGLKTVIISDKSGVTSIGEESFRSCSRLTGIKIPNSVTSIGRRAFFYCSGLTSITIPDSVISIGDTAFCECNGLESIIVSSGNTKYHSSGNCLIETETKTLILGCKNSIIPSDGSVTSIGSYAFFYCSGLTSITIPDSVTSIGASAFYGCSELESIEFNETIAQWNAISKGSSWKFNVPSSCKVKCTDGTISI